MASRTAQEPGYGTAGAPTPGQGNFELRNQLSGLHQTGQVNIVLNLKEVNEIDSAGLGHWYGLSRLSNTGGRLALINLNRAHLKLFLLTKLAIAFEFLGEERDSVNSFSWIAPPKVLRYPRIRSTRRLSQLGPRRTCGCAGVRIWTDGHARNSGPDTHR